MKVILKGDTGSLKIDIIKRENASTNDFWDANWIEANIEIGVFGFSGKYEASFRVDDLYRFYNELVKLTKLEKTSAEFTTLENGLFFKCDANRRGAVTCTGKAISRDNILEFTIDTDLPSLALFERDLKLTLEKYPLKGK
jgi:hypothetical protein